jgi:Domain of unknown function (DUF4160)
MPTIVILGNVKIQMFAGDHHPAHFHVRTPDHEAMVQLVDFSVIAGAIDRRSLDLALTRARDHREALENEWRRLNER